MTRSTTNMATKRSFVLSIAVHLVFLTLLVVNMNNNTASKPIMINLQKNAKPGQNMIKAGVIDRGAIDRARQMQAREERLKAEKAMELAAQQKAQIEATKKLEQEKIVQEKLAQDKIKRDKMLKEKIVQEKILQEKVAREKVLQEKATQEKLAQAKVAQEKTMQKRIDDKSKARDKIIQDKIAQNNAAKQKALGIQAEKDSIQAQEDAFLAKELDKYKAQFAAAIIENRILSSVFIGDLSCTIRIKLLPDGSILSVNIEKTSGNKAYDQMSESAVHKTAPFPMPEQQELYDKLRDVVISFRNGDQGTDVL